MQKYLLTLFIVCFAQFTYSQTNYIVGQSYYGIRDFIEYIPGNLPIILVAPHGGYLEPSDLPIIGSHGRDNGTLETTLVLMDSIMGITNGCRPHVIINHLYANYMNPTMEIDSAAGTNADARQAYEDFHQFIRDAKKEITQTTGKGHYFEMHGNGHSQMWTEMGLGVSPTYLAQSDSIIETRKIYSTVKNLCTVGGANFLEVLKGATSMGGLLQAKGWKSTTSPAYPAPAAGSFFYAGYNTWLHGSKDSGTIDATHVENYYVFMQTNQRNEYAGDLADCIKQFMNIHYGLALDCNTLSTDFISSDLGKVHFFPNPAQHFVHIPAKDLHYSTFSVEMLNPIGLLMYKETFVVDASSLDIEINISSLSDGLYFMRFYTQDGVISNKLLIER